jgi:hypothetical protein
MNRMDCPITHIDILRDSDTKDVKAVILFKGKEFVIGFASKRLADNPGRHTFLLERKLPESGNMYLLDEDIEKCLKIALEARLFRITNLWSYRDPVIYN